MGRADRTNVGANVAELSCGSVGFYAHFSVRKVLRPLLKGCQLINIREWSEMKVIHEDTPNQATLLIQSFTP